MKHHNWVGIPERPFLTAFAGGSNCIDCGAFTSSPPKEAREGPNAGPCYPRKEPLERKLRRQRLERELHRAARYMKEDT